MCLTIVPSATKELRKKTGKITCWKILAIDIQTMQLIAPVMETKYVIGENRSSRRFKTLGIGEWLYDIVNKGIHVYLSEYAAEDAGWANGLPVRVECDIKDLVAVGTSNQAVFMSVNLNQADYHEGVRKLINKWERIAVS